MANVATVTRPYAKAILELARADDSFATWTMMLAFLAEVVQNKHGYKILSNLAIASHDKAGFLCEVGATILNQQGKNLVKLLAKGKRLLILPELYKMYETLRMQEEHETEVSLTIASTVSAQELAFIHELCAKNIGGTVNLKERVEADLIGGGVAQIGNRVINASISGRLQALRNQLNK